METSEEIQRSLAEIAERHQVSREAADVLFRALLAGNGTMAQFRHPELGGSGQWSAGGMIMIGDMFNHALKAKVDALCSDLAGLLKKHPVAAEAASDEQIPQTSQNWWNADLGTPSSAGSQNDVRYAFFPEKQKLALQSGGHVRIYDTGDHRISGVSQQHSGSGTLSFASQHGNISIGDLQEVPAERKDSNDILTQIEQLSRLHDKGVLTDEEFRRKKTELLDRL
jgi:Short C-terminal domain